MNTDPVSQRLTALREAMTANGVAAYLIPVGDPHASEYLPDHYTSLTWFSGFHGENATLVVTRTESALWADGRYFVQAEKELAGTEIRLQRMDEPGVPTVEEYCADCEDIEEMGDVFLMNLSLLKNNLDNLKSFKPRDMKLQEFLAVYKVYEAHKRRNELIDFDDMTAMAYELLTEDSEYLSAQQKKYDYILIDEFQDINKAQCFL